MYKYPITVLTPTYNRANTLNKLFESLLNQKNQNFQWLIIDDGSQDETKKLVKSWSSYTFELVYVKKENGGKHTALNFSHNYINGELVMIVDSDDYLIDTAIEIIINDWLKYKNDNLICGFSYQRCQKNGNLISANYYPDYLISNHFKCRINGSFGGDRCEILRTDIFKKFNFPVFEGEKFMSEGWLWRNIALEYQTVYINQPLYVCEYLEGGLSNSGRLLRINSPKGMMENCKSFFVKKCNIKVQIKQMIAYCTYGFFAHYSPIRIIKQSGRPLRLFFVLPFGIVLYLFWKKKYD